MVAQQANIIAGVFERETQARQVLDALRQAGFSYDQVGVARHDSHTTNLVNDFLGLGVSQDRANYYDQEFKNGRTIVSVRPDGRDQDALSILRRNGAYDYGYDRSAIQTQTSTDAQTPPYNQATDGTNGIQDEFYQPRSLRLREEQLNVNKERVQTGEVHLRKNVVTEQKTINVPVTHEELVIERHPVTDGQIDTTGISEGEIIRIPISEEQITVTKTPVVTGEVEIGKRAVQGTQRVSDTVKREEAQIEREGDVRGQGLEGQSLNNENTTR